MNDDLTLLKEELREVQYEITDPNGSFTNILLKWGIITEEEESIHG